MQPARGQLQRNPRHGCSHGALLLTWPLLFLLTSATQASDSVQVQTHYYSVHGDSIREVRQALNRIRPWKPPNILDAETRWDVRWSYSTRTDRQGCKLTTVQTKTTVTITLPRWSEGQPVPEAVRERWERYTTALAKHEDGHKQLALAAAAEIRKRLRALPIHSDCSSLASAVDQAAGAVLSDFRRREVEYDRLTEHGNNQGAHFP